MIPRVLFSISVLHAPPLLLPPACVPPRWIEDLSSTSLELCLLLNDGHVQPFTPQRTRDVRFQAV